MTFPRRQSLPHDARRRRIRPVPFTLLELLIASTILTAVALLMLAAGNEIMRSWNRMTEENGRFTELLALDRTLERMLGNQIPFLWPDPEVTAATLSGSAEAGMRLLFEGEPDRVAFCYRHEWNTPADGALRFVQLRVEDGKLVASYQERPVLNWAGPSPGQKTSVLADGVSGLELQYADWDPTAKELAWSTQWDPGRKELPLAVWLRVSWTDGRQESWLYRTPGSGMMERFGQWQPAPIATATPAENAMEVRK